MSTAPLTEVEERRAPVQGDDCWYLPHRYPNAKPPGTIAWSEYLSIYEVYAKRYGRDQSPERLAERGGFGYAEIVLITGKEPTTWQKKK